MKKPIILLGTLFIVGFAWGLNLSDFNASILDFKSNESNSLLLVFVNSFTMNFWFLFLMFIASLNKITYPVCFFILIIKGMILGVCLKVFMRSFSILGIGKFLIENLYTILIILPLMFFVILSNQINEKRRIVIIFIVTIIYSLLETFL